jgi:hypothetical protein
MGSPTEADYKRIAQTLSRDYPKVHTAKGFKKIFEDYMSDSMSNFKDSDDAMRGSFTAYSQRHKITDKTFSSKPIRIKKPKYNYNKIGYAKGRPVYSRKDIIIRNKKPIVKYRDEKGRFVSMKKTTR